MARLTEKEKKALRESADFFIDGMWEDFSERVQCGTLKDYDIGKEDETYAPYSIARRYLVDAIVLKIADTLSNREIVRLAKAHLSSMDLAFILNARQGVKKREKHW